MSEVTLTDVAASTSSDLCQTQPCGGYSSTEMKWGDWWEVQHAFMRGTSGKGGQLSASLWWRPLVLGRCGRRSQRQGAARPPVALALQPVWLLSALL